MPFTSNDVAAFAKREHAHRTRLAGFIALVLALSLFILPTLDSPIATSITGDSRLLGPLDLCRREHDDCPTDHSKTKPGSCGCGVSDIDTDGDGTPDCKDRCPSDDSKTNYGVCGCGAPDTDTDGDGTLDCHDRCPNDASKTSPGVCGCVLPDTDTDGDGTLDCRDDCIDNDPYILSFCNSNIGYDCEGCAGKFIRLWKECGGLMCLSDIDYCLDYSFDEWYVYDGSIKNYRSQSHYEKSIQTGADSSGSVFEYWSDYGYNHTYVSLNGVPCSYIGTDISGCLVCDSGNEYCYGQGVLPLNSNPLFLFGDEAATRLLNTCFGRK